VLLVHGAIVHVSNFKFIDKQSWRTSDIIFLDENPAQQKQKVCCR
jgi:hypothetical protein